MGESKRDKGKENNSGFVILDKFFSTKPKYNIMIKIQENSFWLTAADSLCSLKSIHNALCPPECSKG